MAKIKTKERLTAQEWFDIAERFEYSAHALMVGKPDSAFGIIGQPHTVLRAFAVEALLKCIIELGGRKPTWEHNFWALFAQTRPCDRHALRQRWRSQYGPAMRGWNKQKGMPIKRVPVGLDGILKLCGDAFLVIRYLPKEGIMPFLLMNFPLTIRDYVLEVEPTLKRSVNFLKPESQFVKTQNDNLGSAPGGGPKLNRKLAPFDVSFFDFRASDPKDRGAD
jgi:hypothetical protein